MGDEKKSRVINLLEALTLFLAIMLYIWAPRSGWCLVIIAIMVLCSHLSRKESLAKLGFRPTDFQKCFRENYRRLFGLAGLIIYFGLWLGDVRKISLLQALRSVSIYLIWGLAQQYLLNGYFVNRLAGFWGSANYKSTALSAATLFSLAHAPNWFLMAVTFVGGYACVRIFQKYRNIYFLGLAHGLIGFLLYLLVPDSISHGLKVGPAYI